VVTGYDIYWDQGTGTEVIKNASYTLLSFTVTGLTTGTTYNFRLYANNIVGSSEPTSVFPIIAANVPDPPTEFTKDESNSNLTQVALIWTAPINNGGSAVTGYKIRWDAGTGGSMQDYTGSYIGGTSLIATAGINPGTLYKFNIASINIIGSSTFSLVEIVAGTPK
jgi:titin